MYSFPNLEPVCCSMSSSNFCFLTCIQISQGAGQVVWYSHHLKNFPQFIVIHTVKGFGIVNKAEIDVFCNFLAFLMIQRMLAIWSLVPLPFLYPAFPPLDPCWDLTPVIGLEAKRGGEDSSWGGETSFFEASALEEVFAQAPGNGKKMGRVYSCLPEMLEV